MKSGENLYDVSQVRVDVEQSKAEPETNLDPAPEMRAIPGESVPVSAKIRVIPMLAFVVVGILLGQYFLSPAIFPTSRHVLQQFRGAAIGALVGVLMYAMMEYFFPREDS